MIEYLLGAKRSVGRLYISAFVALLKNGEFVAWGDEDFCGKITNEMQTILKNQDVKVIYSSHRAFAALLKGGSVFTWGGIYRGDEIPEKFESKLSKNVKMIFPYLGGFSALCSDGEMITWGKNYDD